MLAGQRLCQDARVTEGLHAVSLCNLAVRRGEYNLLDPLINIASIAAAEEEAVRCRVAHSRLIVITRPRTPVLRVGSAAPIVPCPSSLTAV
ncbi:hypothetical protein HBH56_149550 [Parastagonospora nodorum]|uniref:Uncharacterized protein n=1 Tax=Phaeosphaeria nodorum (strain SN15 / ATCC MYA-4574 / FGSC 10173) TaxID=321614 RepID=A0A7U2EW32_PHANO|nr:hypothetical protein HBH56_149550 [Parastagonospora nodorum]QRC94193.1 hypothetical protein JI435_405320 [Parastagonospora nodorum SN15]KAH3928630.1 hypothetical protein HBH54_135450 [Parastagonospora nodorum]KAH3946041.1 hypothetical protein HBH53_137000 [Parastagonospora nodorum]KAH3983711.1 hypothetical protein HBH52_063010 [Parastagonospora nodorum]